MAGELSAARIHHNKLSAFPRSIFDKGRCDRMITCRIGTDNHDDFGVRGILNLIRYGARPDPLKKRCYR